MAIAFDAAASANSAAASSLTWSHTVSGSDRFLVVGIAINTAGVTCSGVTYNGVAMTQVGTDINSNVRAYLFRLLAPATGAHNVVATLSGSAHVSGGSQSYTGVDQSTPLGASATGNGSGTTASADVSGSTVTGQLVVSAVATQGSATLAPHAPQAGTERWDTQDGSTDADSHGAGGDQAPPVSEPVKWVLGTSKSWAIVVQALHPKLAAVETFGLVLAPTNLKVTHHMTAQI